MIVLAARPSMGKTALAINIAEHVALNEGLPVAVFSMEMGASQLAVRIVGSIGRIDQMHLRTGKLTRRRMAAPDRGDREAAQHLAAHRRDAGPHHQRAARQRAAAGAPVRQAGPDRGRLPAADERVQQHERGEPRHRGRRDLARPEDARQGAAVPGDRAVAADRAAWSRAPTSGPMMSDLRESGAIEQDADVIMFIYRDDYYNKDSQGARRRRDHHQQAAQRPDRDREAGVPERDDAVRVAGFRQRRLLARCMKAGRRQRFCLLAMPPDWG